MNTGLTMSEAWAVLRKNGFCGYMGPGYTIENAIEAFMVRYPRGKGIKGHQKDLEELYRACLTHKQILSRNRRYYMKTG